MKKMVGVKCEECGRISYPERTFCISCGSNRLKRVELGDECELVTYTELYAIPVGIDQLPLVLGIVRFKNGARATGQITTREVKVGMKLRPVWGALRTIRGEKVYGFKFEPIK